MGTVQEEQEMAKAACSNCTFDYKVLLGQLVQRCEKLEEGVESLESRQTAVGKVENMIKQRSQVGSWPHGGLGSGLMAFPGWLCFAVKWGGAPHCPQAGLDQSAAWKEIKALVQMSC